MHLIWLNLSYDSVIYCVQNGSYFQWKGQYHILIFCNRRNVVELMTIKTGKKLPSPMETIALFLRVAVRKISQDVKKYHLQQIAFTLK